MKNKSAKTKQTDCISDKVLADFISKFPKRKTGPLERKFLKTLDAASGEREIHAFLKQHDYLVGMAFRSNSHPRGVVPEFELGAEFRCDFLVLSCCSGWWSADFVELESPDASLYLADRTQARTLRVANRQIRDWKQWTRENETHLRKRFSDLFTKLKLCPSGGMQLPDAAAEIRDPHCTLVCGFHIVIGRRPHLSTDEQRARVQDSLDTGVSIATYDRFVEAARRYDDVDKFGKESFRYWKG